MCQRLICLKCEMLAISLAWIYTYTILLQKKSQYLPGKVVILHIALLEFKSVSPVRFSIKNRIIEDRATVLFHFKLFPFKHYSTYYIYYSVILRTVQTDRHLLGPNWVSGLTVQRLVACCFFRVKWCLLIIDINQSLHLFADAKKAF